MATSQPMHPKGLLFIVSAPSGAGKTSLIKKLSQTYPKFNTTISHTTRQKRVGEQDGVDYHFVSNEQFDTLISQNAFLEHACVHNHQYGTSVETVQQTFKNNQHIMLEIDYQGAAQVKQKMPRAIQILIVPPSLVVLKKRLINRGSETNQSIQTRLNKAKQEILACKHYDYLIVNDEFEQAFMQLAHITYAQTTCLNNPTNQTFIQQLIEQH